MPLPVAPHKTQAALARAAHLAAATADARWNTLQKTPAPISHLDTLPPFTIASHPIIPIPGATGAANSAAALEDS